MMKVQADLKETRLENKLDSQSVFDKPGAKSQSKPKPVKKRKRELALGLSLKSYTL